MKRWICLFCCVSALHAAVVTDPALGAEMDPAGSEEVDVTASTASSQASVEALTDVHVLQDWTGFSGGTDVVSFSDPARPDLRITTSFSSLVTDSRDTAANLQTSSNGQNFAWSGTNGQTITIEFGSWDGSVFTAGVGVKAAGVCFVNFGAAYDTAADQVITYHDADNAVLSTQKFAGAADTSGGVEAYSGYLSGSYNIAKIVISISRSTGSSDIAIDDLAFTDKASTPGTVAMASATVSGPYNETSLSVSVLRTGGTAGAVTIDYASSDGTAEAGTDYTAVGGTLSWADGESGNKTIVVPLLNEPTAAGSDFTVTLSNPQGGVTQGSPAVTTFAITAAVGEGFGTDLVGYLNMDESGDPVEHSVYLLGADTEGTSVTATAVYGNARSFDGSGDRIELDPWDEADTLSDREAVTVSMWFKAGGTTGQRVLFDDPVKHDALGARLDSNKLQVTCVRNGRMITLETAFTDTSSWHHLAVVKNGDALEIYLDGVSVGAVPDLDVAGASAIDAGAGVSFLGQIDEVRLYRRALSSGEITALQVAPALAADAVWRGYHFGQTSATGNAADAVDLDMDGLTNAQEYQAGTDPNDILSLLEITALSIDASGAVTLEWNSAQDGSTPARKYRVMYADGPLSNSTTWMELQGDIEASGSGRNIQADDISNNAVLQRSYRIELQ